MGVTVLFPVSQGAHGLAEALGCITGQSLSDLEILVILNGSDGPTRRLVQGLAAGDPRVRVIELAEANLAAALNRGLREAHHGLVARMDADDLCAPDRLARQEAYLRAHPHLGALGCAWEQQAPDGRIVATIRPATAPAEMRWRLMIANDLAHGSMMLRRAPVVAAGGYDERLERAQDHDLWIRLARSSDIGALPEVLYTHRLRAVGGPYSSSGVQARRAAEVLTRAWAALPGHDQVGGAAITQALGAAMADSTGRGPEHLARFLTEHGPSTEGLLAFLWSRLHLAPLPSRALEVCRRARLREIGAHLGAQGVERLWLWGAGSHSQWLLAHADDLRVPIAGIVDDHLAGGTRLGRAILHPDRLGAGDHVLISSDAFEDQIWDRSAPARARGVTVWRLYGETETTAAMAISSARC